MFLVKRLLSLAAGVGLCFLIDVFAHGRDDYTQRLIVLAGLYVTLSVSLNLINGITGQFSIGHAAFYQIGAYSSGFLTAHYFQNQRVLGTPGIYVFAGGLFIGLLGASVAFSPKTKSPAIRLFKNVALTFAAGLFIATWFVQIPYATYGICAILFLAAWLLSPPEASRATIVLGLSVAAAALVFFLLFRFFPVLPPLAWLIVMLFLGATAAGVAGFVVGLPSLRLRGDYLAIVTMGFGEIIRIEVQNTQALGGAYGMNVAPKIQPIWLVWLLAVTCIAVCRNLVKTAHGLPFLAVREDEVASSAMGVNVTRVKVTAFVIGSMFAGAAGAVFAHYEGFITGAHFSMDISFIILTMVVLGGTGSITGSAVAAAFLSYLPEKLRDLKTPEGTNLTVTAASIAASLLAVVVAVAIIKRVLDHSHRPKLVKVVMYLGAIVLAFGAKFALGAILSSIPAMSQMRVEAGQLRMVIFAVTLIVLMLLRPQGIFGHHEFSWDWVMRLLRLKKNRDNGVPPAVAA